MGIFKIKKNSTKIIFKNNSMFSWSKKYVWVPTSFEIKKKNNIVIFYGSRNKENKTQTGYLIFNIKKNKVIFNTKKPVIKIGVLGEFDESLALGTSIIKTKKEYYFYYVGWTNPKSTRYLPYIGLAKSKKNFSFKKNSEPLLSRTRNEPYGCMSPFVLNEKDKFKMWYAAIRKWIKKKSGETIPIYNLSYAESKNGINWNLKKKNVLKLNAFTTAARPYVLKHNKEYHMWYSERKYQKKYLIKYSKSKNGINWKSKNFKVPTLKKFNDKSSCYPCVFQNNKKFYLLFNGNNYGKTGIAISELFYE